LTYNISAFATAK